LIQAVARIAERGVDVELELVGDGPERARLTELARRLGILPRVLFRGFLTFDRVREAMAEATMLVHPSIGLGDAVPTVIKEAMAVGSPVIASHAAGIPELLDGGRCGVLVPPRDVDALADAIERLLGAGVLRRQYADAGRRYAEQQFDLWRNGSALAARLKSAVRHPRSAEDCAKVERVS
jgi:glycosyltransferase involved in cell wall biosynthesis